MSRKRKPWRRFKKSLVKDHQIRRLCLLLLTAEFLILSHQKIIPFPTVEFTENREILIRQEPDEDPSGRIYGIRIRLKEGVIDFYRQEEIKQERQP